MSLAERLERLYRALPTGASVTLSRQNLIELVGAEQERFGSGLALSDRPDLQVDLTVSQVAEAFGRSPNTVRRWLAAGDLEGYRLHGREWRIARAAIEAFQERQGKGEQPLSARNGTQPLDAWRRVETRSSGKRRDA